MRLLRSVLGLLVLLSVAPLAEAHGPGKPDPFKFLDTGRFMVDVAIDGRTFRLDDGTNPFDPLTFHFTRGDTFVVTGKIYRAGTLQSGGQPGGPNNPPGPDLPDPIGEWVCRGVLNFGFDEIAGGAEPHVTSTQFFYFNDGTMIVTDGPEGGLAPMVRAVVGGTGRAQGARGESIEQAIGTNDTHLANARFLFKLR